MAPRAPRPGTTPSSKKRSSEESFTGFKITMDDDELALNFADIGPMDEQIFESQTGKTLSEVMEKLDHTPNVAAVVWFARRKRGERRLTYRQVLREFPGRTELGEMLEDGTFDIDFVSADDENLSDDVVEKEEEVTSDPLPSDGD